MKEIDNLLLKISKKVDEYEIIKKKISKNVVKVEKGKISDFKESLEIQYSLRIIKDKKIGFTFFTELEDIDKIIQKANSLAEVSGKDELNSIYNNEFECDREKLSLFSDDIEKISFEQMFEFSAVLEDLSYKKDRRVMKVKDAGFFTGKVETFYINSHGIKKNYVSNFSGASVIALANESNSSMMGYEYKSSKKFDFSPDDIADSAVNKAVRMLNARKGSTMSVPVIFENELVGDIFSIIAPSFYIENVYKNKSLFQLSNKDNKIASNVINLSDDATNVNYIGAADFDDEGTPTTKKNLISEGILKDFLYNLYYAKKDKKEQSGNCFLNSFKSAPVITHTNLILTPSDNDIKQFINSQEQGILITNLMGLHMADPVSGEFSLGAEGILIQNGEMKYPVKEMVIKGNILDILKNCKMVFNDVKVSGSIVAPSILVEGLKIVGN